MRMDWMEHWIQGPYHWFWMIIWLLIWIFVIAGLVFLIRALLERKTPVERRAIDILDEKYAKGEITREEYLEKRRDILGA